MTSTARSVGYCRVSTDAQAATGFSLVAQEQAMRDDVAKHGEVWLRAYVDAAVSGRTTERRSELAAMLAAADAREFEIVVIPALDRLGRNTRDLIDILSRLDAAGVAVRSLRGDVITATATGKLQTSIFAALAEFESNVIGERTKSGKAVAARRGRPNGGPRRFGFSQSGGVLEPVAEEVTVVQRVFREFVSGKTQTRIAAGLNADGYRTTRGRPWNQSQISQLIRDPVWIGKIRSRQGVFEGQHAPVIPEDVWDAAHSILKSSGRRAGGRPTDRFLLGNGLLRCGRCGHSMRVRSEPKKYGYWESYSCGGRESGATDCDQRSVPRNAIDAQVLAYFNKVGLDVDAMIREQDAIHEELLAGVLERKSNARRLLLRAESNLARLDKYLREGRLSPSEWRAVSDVPRREMAAARDALHDLEEEELRARTAKQLQDAENRTLEILAEVRAAVAGEISRSEGLAATQAAIRRVFSHFVLHDRRGPNGLMNHAPNEPGYVMNGLEGRERVLEPVVHEEMILSTFATIHDEDGREIGLIPDELQRVPISLSGKEAETRASRR